MVGWANSPHTCPHGTYYVQAPFLTLPCHAGSIADKPLSLLCLHCHLSFGWSCRHSGRWGPLRAQRSHPPHSSRYRFFHPNSEGETAEQEGRDLGKRGREDSCLQNGLYQSNWAVGCVKKPGPTPSSLMPSRGLGSEPGSPRGPWKARMRLLCMRDPEVDWVQSRSLRMHLHVARSQPGGPKPSSMKAA